MKAPRKPGRPPGTTKPAEDRCEELVQIYVTAEEKHTLELASDKAEAKSLSAWGREKLLAAAGEKSSAATELRRIKAALGTLA